MLLVLTACDFRARYRRQALGVLWSLASPVLMTALMSFILSSAFGSTAHDLPTFLLIGLIVWQWAVSSVAAGTRVYSTHGELLRIAVFPRGLLPVAIVLSQMCSFVIQSLLLIVFIGLFPQSFSLSWALPVVPLLLIALAVLLVGITLTTSVLCVVYRDVSYL